MKKRKKASGVGALTAMPIFQCWIFSIIILTSAIVRQSLGTILFPSGKAARLARAAAIVDACAVSTYVTIAPPVIIALNALITAYRDADAAGNKAAFKVLNNAIRSDLLAPFQKAANNDPSNAESILRSGAFYVTVYTGHGVSPFGVSDTPVSGTVEISAPGGGNKWHFHQWFYSMDNVTWVTLMPTNKSKTTVAGLAVGKKVYFKHQLVVKDVPQGMSVTIDLVIR